MAGAVTELAAGSRLGPWIVLATVGRGGMSEVYAVRHDGSGQRGALKVLQHQASARPNAAERFALEARILDELRHPGVPAMFERGHCTDGRPYIVMELLLGTPLAEVIGHGRLPRPLALEILAQVGDVLAAAHARGIVHRDVKPENVVLLDGERPVAKLVDWGVAKRLDADAGDLRLTSTGAIVGTPRYLSPEQVRADPVDERTDVYALGLLAYELLLGAYPFETESLAEALLMQMTKSPPSPRRFWPDIPPQLERTLVQMLAKDPQRRPTLAGAIAVLRDVPSPPPDAPTALQMRSGQLDFAETVVDERPGVPPTARWRPLRR